MQKNHSPDLPESTRQKSEPEFCGPIDNAERQRDARKLKDEQKAAGMTDAEIKASRRRKKFDQEDHHDDCGSDFESLEEKRHQTMLPLDWFTVMSIVDSACFQDNNLGADLTDDMKYDDEDVTGDHFVWSHFHGSEVQPATSDFPASA